MNVLMTEWSGAWGFMPSLGVRRMNLLELMLLVAVVGVFSVLGAHAEFITALALGAAAAWRSLRLVYWGLEATRLPESRPLYLEGAKAGRLIGCGLALLVGAAALVAFDFVQVTTDPKGFGRLIRKSHEGATKGDLGRLREALDAYRKDAGGAIPADLAPLIRDAKYIGTMPKAKTAPYHRESSAVRYASAADDSGGWVYDNSPRSPTSGQWWVNCTHTDSKGTVWTAY